MKKYLIVLVSILMVQMVQAQEKGRKDVSRKDRHEKLEAMKVAHLTKALDLNSEQAQLFWPKYNEYTQKKKELRKEHKGKEIEEMSDREAESYLENMQKRKKDALLLEQAMLNDMKTVLSAQQRVQLLKSEKKFHQAVAKRYVKHKKKQGKRKHKEEMRGSSVDEEKQ